MLDKCIDSRTALRSEAYTKFQNGFSKILKYKTTKDRIPPTLKVSPASYIPHEIRNHCVIIDLYFRLNVNGKYLLLVNNVMVKRAHQ